MTAEFFMKTLSLILLFFIGLYFSQPNPGDWNTQNSKLTDFTVYGHEDHIKITWSTLSRNEIFTYEIQRSQDAKTFETFKLIDGGVDEPKAMEYFEVDYDPYLGWSYYRIKQIIGDKDSAFSGVAPVFYGLDRVQKGTMIVPIDPNDPNTKVINLSDYHDQKLLLVLRNYQGEEVYISERLKLVDGKLVILADDRVAQGIYVVVASTRDELIGMTIIAE